MTAYYARAILTKADTLTHIIMLMETDGQRAVSTNSILVYYSTTD